MVPSGLMAVIRTGFQLGRGWRLWMAGYIEDVDDMQNVSIQKASDLGLLQLIAA